MRIALSGLTLPLVFASCVGAGLRDEQAYFHEGTFEHLAEDTFMVVQVDAEALFESELWEEMLDDRDFEDEFEKLQEAFEGGWGGQLNSVSSLTISMAGGREEPFVLVRSEEEFDLEEFWVREGRGTKTEVAFDDDGGDGFNAAIEFVVPKAGDYWLTVKRSGAQSVAGEVGGRAGSEIFRETVTHGERLGPFQMEPGDEFEAVTNCSGDPQLTLSFVADAEIEVEGVTIYGDEGGSVMCIEEGVYVISPSTNRATSLLRELADEDWEFDEDMLAMLDQAGRGAEILGAVSFDAKYRDRREQKREDLNFLRDWPFGLSERVVDAIDDISGLAFAIQLGSDAVEFSLKVVCEDADAAEVFQGLLEELLEFLELEPLEDEIDVLLLGVMQKLLDEVEASGEVLKLSCQIESKDLLDLIEEMN